MFKLNGNFWVFLKLQFYNINQSQILTYLPVNYPFGSWCVTNITQVAFGLTLLLINSTQKIQKDFSSPSYWEDMTSINTPDRISKADYEYKAWAPHDVRGETQLQRADLWLMLFMYSHTNIQHMQINKKSKIIQTKVWFLVKFKILNLLSYFSLPHCSLLLQLISWNFIVLYLLYFLNTVVWWALYFHSKGFHIYYREVCPSIFIAALFTIAWK